MLFFKKSANVIIEPQTNNNIEFTNAIRYLNQILQFNETLETKIDNINYFLEVVKKDLQYEMLADIFYSDVSKNATKLISNYYIDENGNDFHIGTEKYKEVDTNIITTITGPHNIKGMNRAVNVINRDGFEYRNDNHRAFYYPFLNLCIVYGGNHSISAGIVKKQAKLPARICNDISLFPHVYTDGTYWYNTHTNEKSIPVLDFRMAVLYEAAKLKYYLISN